MADKPGPVKRLGEIVVREGWVTWAQLDEALNIQKNSGRVLGEILVDKGYLTDKNLARALAIQFDMSYVDFDTITLPPDIINYIPRRIAFEHRIMPLIVKNRTILIAISNPMNVWPETELKNTLVDYEIRIALGCPRHINEAIEKYYGSE